MSLKPAREFSLSAAARYALCGHVSFVRPLRAENAIRECIYCFVPIAKVLKNHIPFQNATRSLSFSPVSARSKLKKHILLYSEVVNISILL